MEQEKQTDLPQYNKRTWSKSVVLGGFLGLGVIVPGVSGSTVAIIFKLYNHLLYAIGNVFKQFKSCFVFLLPIILGMVVGLLGGFIGVKTMLKFLPFATIGLFGGLMSGAFPAVKDELDGVRVTQNPKLFALSAVGVLIPVAIGVLSVALENTATSVDVSSTFATPSVWLVLACIAVGYAVGITQVVPGLSATAILMVLGWFAFLVDSISLTYWKANPSIFIIYFALGGGFLLGITTFSKLLTFLFAKFKTSAFSVIVGLSLGSIISMFFNPDVFAVYQSWWQNGINFVDLGLALILFVAGFIASLKLVRSQKQPVDALS